jgi:hypothetical protein
MRRLISNLIHARAAAAVALLFVIAGCRHADVNRELVERELRLQEDELYRLHDEIAERERLLETARRENAALERDLQSARAGGAIPRELLPDLPPAPDEPPPERTPRRDSGVPPIDVEPPVIKVPGLEGPMPPPPGRSSWKSTRGVRRASFEQPADEPTSEAQYEPKNASGPESTDDVVAKIVLNRRLTRGYNADRRLGDEGIVVVIEPRNKVDRIVSAPGKVAVVVVDPALSTAEGRVARWDFNAEEIRERLGEGPSGDGIQLELAWPGRLPEHDRLMLFVRFTTADGEVHEASQPILVDLAADAQDVTAGAE